MKTGLVAALAAGCLLSGMGVGFAAKDTYAALDLMRGKPPKEAGLAALQQAEKLAGKGSWELLGVARVYYLSGDKTTAQAMIDKVLAGKPDPGDWQRAGAIYAEAGETARAEELFQRVLAADKKQKDDTGRAEIGAWYIRIGQRDKGEELLGQALTRNPDEVWHYLRAAEAYLGVPAGR